MPDQFISENRGIPGSRNDADFLAITFVNG
jgi:hypothetical protein